MDVFFLLGLIQGLTEFLPISSSGHLVLAETWLNVDKPGLLFDALVHLGTIGSVLFYYRRHIWQLLKDPFGEFSMLMWKALLIAMIPTIIIGLSLKDTIELAFDTPALVAAGLIWTGVVLFISSRFQSNQHALGGLKLWHFLVIGTVQGIAIFPGVSRSGMTIAAALLLGMKREDAAEFSFFLAIPTILGATVFQVSDALNEWDAHAQLLGEYGIGMLAALLSGIAAIGLLLRVLKQGRLHRFAYYCWTLGAIVLAWAWSSGQF
jgi:undecaprenyl-diphosphatase